MPYTRKLTHSESIRVQCVRHDFLFNGVYRCDIDCDDHFIASDENGLVEGNGLTFGVADNQSTGIGSEFAFYGKLTGDVKSLEM